uniref:Uncharacterized protein n=1 Tax=Phlebotomus papatasi TaxID=29031 RepID=A0A1B0D6P7_PHLPP
MKNMTQIPDFRRAINRHEMRAVKNGSIISHLRKESVRECGACPVMGFYINYITKTTTFDDPRIKHRQSVSTGTGTTNYGNSTESIPMQ